MRFPYAGRALGKGKNARATALLAAMSVKPDAAVQGYLNTFMANMSQILDKMDLAYFLASHDQQSRNLNIMAPGSFTLTEAGSGAFSPYVGYAADTSGNQYLATGFTASTHAQKGTLNNTEMGIFVLDNAFDPNQSSMSECGGNYTQIKALETQLVTGAPTTVAWRANRAATQRNTSGVITNAVGLYSAVRSAANLNTGYRNGLVLASGSGASVQLDNTEWYIGKANGGAPSVRQLGFFYAGQVLTTQQRLDLYSALLLYLSQIGTYIPSNATAPPNVGGPDPYAPDASYVWSEAYQGTPLDLTGYSLTHETIFDDLGKVAKSGIGATSATGWYSPVRSWAYSNGQFAPYDAAWGAYTIDPAEGRLRMRMAHDGSNWRACHIQTAESDGRGFSQTKGYWEVRAKTPPQGSWGAWPAPLWLYGTGLYTAPSLTRPEIDGCELYPGNDLIGHHGAVHLRPGNPYVNGQVSQHWQKGAYEKIANVNDGQWHTHGIEITDTLIRIFFDGLELYRMPTHPDFVQPLHMLISLQHLLAENDKMNTSVPLDMWVDYARVYAKP